MPPRQRDDWIQQQLTEWGAAVEKMLLSSGIGFPKRSPIANMMEYGCSVHQGSYSQRTVQGVPQYLKRLDSLVSALPDGQRTIVELRYVADLSLARVAAQLGVTISAVRTQLQKIHHQIDGAWSRTG